jgi:hypothetical protein
LLGLLVSIASKKPIILFVHGGWHSLEHYRTFLDILEAKGYTVVAPDLPSGLELTPENPAEADIKLFSDTARTLTDEGNEIVRVLLKQPLPPHSSQYSLRLQLYLFCRRQYIAYLYRPLHLSLIPPPSFLQLSSSSHHTYISKLSSSSRNTHIYPSPTHLNSHEHGTQTPFLVQFRRLRKENQTCHAHYSKHRQATS